MDMVIVIWRLGCWYYGGDIDDDDINDDVNGNDKWWL